MSSPYGGKCAGLLRRYFPLTATTHARRGFRFAFGSSFLRLRIAWMLCRRHLRETYYDKRREIRSFLSMELSIERHVLGFLFDLRYGEWSFLAAGAFHGALVRWEVCGRWEGRCREHFYKVFAPLDLIENVYFNWLYTEGRLSGECHRDQLSLKFSMKFEQMISICCCTCSIFSRAASSRFMSFQESTKACLNHLQANSAKNFPRNKRNEIQNSSFQSSFRRNIPTESSPQSQFYSISTESSSPPLQPPHNSIA